MAYTVVKRDEAHGSPMTRFLVGLTGLQGVDPGLSNAHQEVLTPISYEV